MTIKMAFIPVPDVVVPDLPPGMPDPLQDPDAYLAWAKAQNPERRVEIEAWEAQLAEERAREEADPLARSARNFGAVMRLWEQLRSLPRDGRRFKIADVTHVGDVVLGPGEYTIEQIAEVLNDRSLMWTAAVEGGAQIVVTAKPPSPRAPRG